MSYRTQVRTEPRTKPRRYSTLTDAGSYAGLSVKTLRRYISSGRLTGYRIGSRQIRVDLNEVDDLFTVIPAGEAGSATTPAPSRTTS